MLQMIPVCSRTFRVAVSALFLAMVVLPYREEVAANQTRDNVGIAQAIVRASFPELSGMVSVGMYRTDIQDDWHSGNPVFVSVNQRDRSTGDHSRLVLSAIIETRGGGRLGAARFSGEFVESKLGDVLTVAKKYGGDISTAVIAEMRRRGVKFLPPENEGFIAALNLSRFAAVLGDLRSAEAKLIAAPPPYTPDELAAFFRPSWLLKMKTGLVRGEMDCYDLMIDPLTLRPTRIENEPCDSK